MTKKDFIALADAIRKSKLHFSSDQLIVLTDFCKARNPAFKLKRWIDYINGECGPSGGKRK